MLNILNGVKLAQDDSTGDVYAVDCVDGPKKLTGGGGGGSVPKPLTYDYMPEGYPSKSVQTTTLMEEQELAFADMGSGTLYATPPEALAIAAGQTYTVRWDGTVYERVCLLHNGQIRFLGNLSILGMGDDTGEPFLYVAAEDSFFTLDASASHIIGVTIAEEIVTPMAEKFLPANVKNTTVFYL